MSGNSFRGAPTLPTFARPQSFKFLSWEHLKSVVHAAAIEDGHLTNAYLMPVRPFATAIGQAVFGRVHACIDSDRGHFELLL